MNEQIEARHVIKHTNTLKGFLTWLSITSGIIVLGVATYGVILVRQYIPIVGYVIIISVSVVPAIALCFLVTMLIKYIMKADFVEIGANGHVMRFFGKITEINPLGIKEHRMIGAKEHTKNETFKAPELLTVLHDGLLSSVELLLGYHVDGTPRFGSWDDLRTFVVAGKSRSGKTVTMVFFIVQALIAGANVIVCDPHYNKKTGLLKVIEPLIPFLTIARTDEEIINAAYAMQQEMKARVDNNSTMPDVPMLFVVDEWSQLLRDLSNEEIEILVDLILGCAEAYAGFNGYAMIAGHEWTARESGGKKGAAIRRAFHSVFVHRLDEDYAKFLLTGSNKRMSKTAPNLPTGNAHFQDSEGMLDYLVIPYYGAKKEGIYQVAEMLQSLDAPSQPAQLDTPPTTPRLDAPSPLYQDVRHNQEVILRNAGINPDEALPSRSVTMLPDDMILSDNTDEEKTKNFIIRLRKRNIAHRDIAYSVGMYGARYNEYQAFCIKHNIPITDVPSSEVVKQ